MENCIALCKPYETFTSSTDFFTSSNPSVIPSCVSAKQSKHTFLPHTSQVINSKTSSPQSAHDIGYLWNSVPFTCGALPWHPVTAMAADPGADEFEPFLAIYLGAVFRACT